MQISNERDSLVTTKSIKTLDLNFDYRAKTGWFHEPVQLLVQETSFFAHFWSTIVATSFTSKPFRLAAPQLPEIFPNGQILISEKRFG